MGEKTVMNIKDLYLVEEKYAHTAGKLETARETVLEVLEVRFGPVPYLLAERVNHLKSTEVLRQLHRRAIVAEFIQTFADELPAEG